MTQFEYCRIDAGLTNVLANLVVKQQSAVLLGLRDIGKRYVLHRLRDRLNADGRGPLVELELLVPGGMAQEGQLRDVVAAAVAAVMPGDELGDASGSGPFELCDLIRSLSVRSGKPVVLLAANVDALANHLARRFLREIRSGVEAGWLVVVLSGEEDLCDLVHGPDSEWECAHQFVIQGFGPDEFERFLRCRAEAARLPADLVEESGSELYRLTGGNIHLLRHVLWGIIDAEARGKGGSAGKGFCERLAEGESWGLDSFHYTRRIIDRDPRCWDDLRNLLEGGKLRAGIAPHLLELAGVAVRNTEGTLEFTSELMRRFASTHYTTRRWGDLHASQGDWRGALKFYEDTPLDERLRPLGVDDRLDVLLALKALSASLFSQATRCQVWEDLNSLRRLFADTCHLVLGFAEVTYWEFSVETQQWQPLGSVPVENVRLKGHSLLSEIRDRTVGVKETPAAWKGQAVTAVLPSVRPDQQDAVVVSNFARSIRLSRSREQYVIELLSNFKDAYSHALRVIGGEIRLKDRDQHMDIAKSLLWAVGSSIQDAEKALSFAAQGLRKLGYSRVFFSLVDSTGDWIQGVEDEQDPGTRILARLTKYPLHEPDVDVQPWVIHHREPRPVPDPRRNPLANRKAVLEAAVQPFAVVPILNRSKRAVGTIHVERADQKVPSPTEIEDLMMFGEILAIVIERSERVNFFENTLNEIEEPVVMIDRRMRLRYANVLAARELDVPRGWKDRDEAPAISEKILAFQDPLFRALQGGQRTLRLWDAKDEGLDLAFKVHCDTIRGWRAESVGALLHLEDLRFLRRILRAFSLVAEQAHDVESLARAMLEAARCLRREWARIYLLEDNNQVLRGKANYHETNKALETELREMGGLVMRRTPENELESWRTVDLKEPLVYHYDPAREPFEKFYTPEGLECINIKDPYFKKEVGRKIGDYWLDFPLVTTDRVLGKITLSCDASMKPEEFELLKLLARMITELLDKVLQKRQREEHERMVREASDRAIAFAAHAIKNQVAPLSGTLRQFETREERLPELKPINQRLRRYLLEIEDYIKAIRRTFATVEATPALADVFELVRTLLDDSLAPGQWTIQSDLCPPTAMLDTALIRPALLHLVQNSREAVQDPDSLRIEIQLSRQWDKGIEKLVIKFADHGPGVPQEFKERIFEPAFSRRPDQEVGRGLGLSYVRKVMDAHAGRIEEKGVEYHGVIFVMEFPQPALVR